MLETEIKSILATSQDEDWKFNSEVEQKYFDIPISQKYIMPFEFTEKDIYKIFRYSFDKNNLNIYISIANDLVNLNTSIIPILCHGRSDLFYGMISRYTLEDIKWFTSTPLLQKRMYIKKISQIYKTNGWVPSPNTFIHFKEKKTI